ncbi:angiopoietin-related protein 4 [Oreochromis niloticus]|uniref:Angiopoietin-related protein 4 n=1 Tax=Oreochromis niloticus TaxID=8128 RepID=I3K4D7_ORENI|nr:angiopoietin-related protein 4 [Oreochromis niloticus]XP_005454074.1 angiopoietin-related protein 4 [Oreochromis niloticus]CAI5685016.1 unnamed protein product [Mustela putorius furo]
MKMPQLLILLVTILVHAAVGFPTDRRAREKQASWDDVNVVAHGLLQLGLGLKEHVDKAKAQMSDINTKLKAFNGTVAELERKQREQDEAMKARSKGPEESQRLAELAEEVKKQTADLNSRMDWLQGALTERMLDSNDSGHSGVPMIQLLLAQNKRVDQLEEKLKLQQDKLEKQSLQLQALQNKISHKRVKAHRRKHEEMALRGEAQQIHTESGLAGDRDDLLVRGQRASRDGRSRRQQLWKQAASSSKATEQESNSLNAGHLKMTPASPNH